uniref:Reverse transcriptase domain-containing protein n=2 Tax=Fagus sylvatica TaxID=28930 RepID=A0A2N9H9Z1_FAGSY
MNASLLQPFLPEEVTHALFQMNPSKSPGPDGMTALFFQKFWNIVGTDVTTAVLDFLNSGRMLGSMNFTHIALIPKVKSPECMAQFRPISLCNVVYKIISKILVNRMKSILPQVISDSQSAFVPGRMITDNVMTAFEVVHYLKNLRVGKNAQMAAKLDMSKAYDRVEWDFLKEIFLKLGFHVRWVHLVMECVTSVSYAVKVNGEPKGHIKPSRGLRQGDPLSPYLFLICAEGLSALLRKAERDNLIQGVAICRGSPRISHLFFADDSVIFCRATNADCVALHNALSLYERASGQKVNGNKTALFFSPNTPHDTRTSITTLFGTSPTTHFEKYLGLPPVMGRSKKRAFNEIKDRVWRRLQGWKEKLLSQAGREVLIKAVIQAIPTYAMSCFKFPAGLCSDICSMANRFWWGQRQGERKIHWLSKHKLIKPKSEGGMGFRDIQLFNQALLARQGWRLLHNPHSLIHKLFKAKYFPHCNFLEATVHGNASFIWRSICDSKQVLIDGMRWRVGSGEKIKIWKDPWLPCLSTYKVISPMNGFDEHATVDSLIIRESMCWNVPLLENIFLPRDVELIRQIPLSIRRPPDIRIWNGTKKGVLTVKSAYHFLRTQQTNVEASSSSLNQCGSNVWSSIWSAKVQPKVRMFLWRACRNILPTQTNLFDRGVSQTYSCKWCLEEAETSDHVLWQCEFAQRVWQASPISFPSSYDTRLSFGDLLSSCIHDLNHPSLELFFITAWELWCARNELFWNETNVTVDDICQKAACRLVEFLDVTA